LGCAIFDSLQSDPLALIGELYLLPFPVYPHETVLLQSVHSQDHVIVWHIQNSSSSCESAALSPPSNLGNHLIAGHGPPTSHSHLHHRNVFSSIAQLLHYVGTDEGC
jgi:hypothetical protein